MTSNDSSTVEATTSGFSPIEDRPGGPATQYSHTRATNLPKISIITPCLNDAAHLCETLRSIHDQQYTNLEHIVVDGGSTDGSVDLIRCHSDKLAWWCSEPDDGHADALWKGLSRATGDIVTWVCSNDLLLPGALQRVSDFFQANPDSMWAVGHGLVLDEQSKVIERVWAVPFTFRSILYWELWGTCQPATFIRRSALEKVGGIDRSLNLCVDTDLFIRLARIETPAVINHFLGALRIHPDSQTLMNASRVRETNDRIRLQQGSPGWPAAVRALLYKFYYYRYRGIQIVNETLRREKHYQIGAPVGAQLN